MNENSVKVRILISSAMLALAMTGVGFRLASLHLYALEEVKDKIARSKRIESTIAAPRGLITDRSGDANILAANLVMKDVCGDPSIIALSNAQDKVAARLASVLSVPRDELMMRLTKPGTRFVYIKRFVPEELAEKTRGLKPDGVFLKDVRVRHYPQGSFMCHVIGFVNHEGVGSAGVEQTMEKYLCGSPGYLESGVDALREEVYTKREYYVPEIPGANVTLTLDQNVQYVVEKTLEDVMKEHHPKGAWAIVERIRTGEILAMAGRPAYDPNDFTASTEQQRLNRAIGYVYEPGSTFKVIAISAALNEDTVAPETVYDCENGAWSYCGKVLRDYHPYGSLTVADGVKKSSNILTAKVALTLTEKKFYEYLQAYGIGRKTGVDLPGEEEGILHPVSKWSGISQTRIAIGQGVALTALQMLNVYCGIANDGYVMRPYVIKSITRRNGTILYEGRPEVVSRPISGKTSSTMRALLKRVTGEGGTGTRARVEGYDVAGKTGSAQKPEGGGYSSTAYMASFVGVLPADDPEVAIIVVVDEPQPLHTGGVVAAPAFKSIASQVVRCLDIPPVRTRIAEQRSEDSLERNPRVPGPL